MEKIIIDHTKFKTLAEKIISDLQKDHRFNNINYIWGIPRGGVPLAEYIAERLRLKLISQKDVKTIPVEKILVVDDLIGSGQTVKEFQEAGYLTAVLIVKEHSEYIEDLTFFAMKVKREWINFFWEQEEKGGFEEGKKHITRLIQYMQENPNKPSLIETPTNVISMYDQFFSKKTDFICSEKKHAERTVYEFKSLSFVSFDEKYLLPYYGKFSIVIKPDKYILLEKDLKQFVESYCARVSNIKTLCHEIATQLLNYLNAKEVSISSETIHTSDVVNNGKVEKICYLKSISR